MSEPAESLKDRHHGAAVHFLGACFATAWGFALAVLLSVGPAEGQPGAPGGTAVEGTQADVFQSVLLLLLLIPWAVALSLRLIRKDSAGALGWPTVRLFSYVKVYLLATIYALGSLGLSLVFGVAFLDPARDEIRQQLLSGAGMSSPAASTIFLLLHAATIAPAIWTALMLLEEYGWRGYLLTRLPESWSPRRTIFTAGCLWAVWQLPFVLLLKLYGDEPLWAVIPIALAVGSVHGAILGHFLLSERSIWIPALAQGVLAAHLSVTSLYFTLTHQVIGGPLGLIGLAFPSSYLVWLLWTGRFGSPVSPLPEENLTE